MRGDDAAAVDRGGAVITARRRRQADTNRDHEVKHRCLAGNSHERLARVEQWTLEEEVTTRVAGQSELGKHSWRAPSSWTANVGPALADGSATRTVERAQQLTRCWRTSRELRQEVAGVSRAGGSGNRRYAATRRAHERFNHSAAPRWERTSSETTPSKAAVTQRGGEQREVEVALAGKCDVSVVSSDGSSASLDVGQPLVGGEASACQSAPVAKKCSINEITAPLRSTAADASSIVRNTVNGDRLEPELDCRMEQQRPRLRAPGSSDPRDATTATGV